MAGLPSTSTQGLLGQLPTQGGWPPCVPCPPPALPGSSPARADLGWAGSQRALKSPPSRGRAARSLPLVHGHRVLVRASLTCFRFLDHSDGKPCHSGEQGGDAEGLSTSWGTSLSRPVVLSVLSCLTGCSPRPAWSNLPCLPLLSSRTGAELSLPLTPAANTSQRGHAGEHDSCCPPPTMAVCMASWMLSDLKT